MPALIFDCDGVLADTERDGHLVAFNQMFVDCALPVHWSDDDYRVLLKIGGGKERLATLFSEGNRQKLGLPEDATKQKDLIALWHRTKTALYTQMVRDGALPARPGIRRIVQEAAERGWLLGVASTSAEESVRAVLQHAVGQELAKKFVVCAGDIVPKKKPAPDIYVAALDSLGVSASDAVAVEDSANGLQASLAAGIATVVTVSSYTRNEDFTGASLVVDMLGEPGQPAQVIGGTPGELSGGYVHIDTLEKLLN